MRQVQTRPQEAGHAVHIAQARDAEGHAGLKRALLLRKLNLDGEALADADEGLRQGPATPRMLLAARWAPREISWVAELCCSIAAAMPVAIWCDWPATAARSGPTRSTRSSTQPPTPHSPRASLSLDGVRVLQRVGRHRYQLRVR